MSNPIYPDFLKDEGQYRLSAAAWRQVFETANERERVLFGWEAPWVDESWRDGNPIFSAWSPILRKGLRIIQHAEAGNLALWFNVFAKDSPDAVRELVISCALTAESLAVVKDLVATWLGERASVEISQAA